MKTSIILSMALALGFSVPTFAHAKQHGPATTIERFKGDFTLVATPDAPEGAKGKAKVEWENDDGTETSSLDVSTQGLDAGVYTVSIVAGGSTIPVGEITIEDTGNNEHKSKTEFELPGGVSGTDIQQVTVSLGGIDLLVGNLTDEAGKSKASLDATVPLIAGDAAPEANGFAKLKSTVKKGTVKTKFTLLAFDVPPDSTFTVEVNGADAGTVTSNKKGKAMVKKLPSDITEISVVRLVDSEGGEVARVEF